MIAKLLNSDSKRITALVLLTPTVIAFVALVSIAALIGYFGHREAQKLKQTRNLAVENVFLKVKDDFSNFLTELGEKGNEYRQIHDQIKDSYLSNEPDGS